MSPDIFLPDSVDYILRTYLTTWNHDDRIAEMIWFCKEMDTRHVMLFTGVQHICSGQLTLGEARPE